MLGAAAAQAAACPEQDRGTLEEWKCFGEVEYASRTEGQDDFAARFVFFDGRERLYEMRDAGGLRVMLRGDGYAIFRGLRGADSTVVGSDHPFLFFEFSLVMPYIALYASEGAPSALPLGTLPVRYAGAGKAAPLMREMGIRSVEGALEHPSADEYSFRAKLRGMFVEDLHMTVSGRWSGARREPWPDSTPVAGWQHGCPRPRGADVRGNYRTIPAGVTLGEIRRGWQGRCD